MGQMESPSSWKIVKLVFLRKADCPEAAVNSSDISDVDVVCNSVLFIAWKRKKSLRIGRICTLAESMG